MATTLPLRNGAYECVKVLDAKLLGTKGTAGSGITAKQDYTAVKYLTLTVPAATSIATVDATTNGAQGSKLLFTFPEANVTILGATSNLTLTKVGSNITATAAVIASVGTAVAGVDVTLTGTEADIIPSTAATLTAGVGAFKGESTSSLMKDGTTTPVPVYLNIVVPDAGSTGNDAFIVTGTIVISYTTSGDN